MANKPTILFLVEGLGMSAAKAGNAFFSSSQHNFLDLWRSYGHTLIKPNLAIGNGLDLCQDSSSDFGALSSGTAIPHDQQFVTNSILDNSIFENFILDQTYEKVIQKNSALHFIGNLGDRSGKYGNISHLKALLRWAKNRRMFRIYIHLILDNADFTETRDVLASLDSLSKDIDKIGCGEIASITGSNSIHKTNLDSVISAIVSGKGKNALSADQAIVLHGKKVSSISDFPPSVVTFRGKPIGKFNSFDSVILFNHNSANLERLTHALCNHRSKLIPRFVDTVALFDNFLRRPEALRVAFLRRFSNTIPELLADNGKKTLLLCKEGHAGHTRYFSGNAESEFIKIKAVRESTNKKTLSVDFLSDLFSEISKNIGKFDLLVIDYPLMWEASKNGELAQIVKEIEIFDKALHQLSKFMLQLGGNLVVTSPFGYSEQLNGSDPYSKTNFKSKNPLPFLLISHLSAKHSIARGVGDEMVYDMLKVRHKFTDTAPTLLRLFGIPQPTSMNGLSFLDELINCH